MSVPLKTDLRPWAVTLMRHIEEGPPMIVGSWVLPDRHMAGRFASGLIESHAESDENEAVQMVFADYDSVTLRSGHSVSMRVLSNPLHHPILVKAD